MMINKIWCKISVCFSYIFNISSYIQLDFHELIRVGPLKYLMLLGGISNK